MIKVAVDLHLFPSFDPVARGQQQVLVIPSIGRKDASPYRKAYSRFSSRWLTATSWLM